MTFRSYLAPALSGLVVVMAACGVETAPPPPLSEMAAFDRLQATVKALTWPQVRVHAPTPKDPPLATDEWMALQARVERSPEALYEAKVAELCAPGGDRAALMAMLRTGAGAPGGDDPAQARIELDRLKVLAISWTVDLVRFLEAPETGPDVEILDSLPHYASLKALLVSISERWRLHPPETEAELRSPETLADVHALALELVGVLLDIKRNYAPDQSTALAFAGQWLAVDFSRYITIADDGLPRFERIGRIAELHVDTGAHFWSPWSVDDQPATDAVAELAALEEHRRAVRDAWTSATSPLRVGVDEALAATMVCEARSELAKAVAAGLPDAAKVASPAANRLRDRLNDTWRLVLVSPDPELNGKPTTP